MLAEEGEREGTNNPMLLTQQLPSHCYGWSEDPWDPGVTEEVAALLASDTEAKPAGGLGLPKLVWVTASVSFPEWAHKWGKQPPIHFKPELKTELSLKMTTETASTNNALSSHISATDPTEHPI